MPSTRTAKMLSVNAMLWLKFAPCGSRCCNRKRGRANESPLRLRHHRPHNGNAWWDEACVCKDREPLLEVVENLNEEWRSIKAGDCGCDEKDKRK